MNPGKMPVMKVSGKDVVKEKMLKELGGMMG